MLIDSRAGSKDLMQYEPLRSTATLCQLEFGDVCIAGNGPEGAAVLVGVEVKSMWDLVSSMNTGRLQDTQIPGMLKSYDVAWLLAYGPYKPGPQGELLIPARGRSHVRKMGSVKIKSRAVQGNGLTWRPLVLGRRPVPYGYLENFLFDLAALGIKVKHVHDEREAVIWLTWLENWWSKPWSKHKGMRVFDRSHEISLMPGMSDDAHLRARIAAQLPGVGFERAVAAAQHFPNIRAMINAGAREWENVPGIGKVIAKAVEGAVK